MRKGRLLIIMLLHTFVLHAVSITGTLPVVYITTGDGQAITSKEEYKAATVYIDPLETGKAGLGSASAPIAAQVKGRGNYTWKDFDKKPYKIKFDKKQTVFGMPSNKHWVLLAGADDDLGFLRNPVGFMLSRAIGLRWTPGLEPVELVLNGQYSGLYFLAEHVRVGSNRVNVTEQEDGETDPAVVSGGWLVEIDNYAEDNRIDLYDKHGRRVMITPHSPEVLSAEQREYAQTELYKLQCDIEETDGNWVDGNSPLSQRLDIVEAAKYYLVQEIMEDCESYHGSCYLYKDRDNAEGADKWKFGPVWDFGNAYMRRGEKWIYTDPSFAQYWIEDLAQHADFQQAVQEQWWIFYHEYKDQIKSQITSFVASIAQAAKNDAQVWNGTSNYRNNSDMTAKRDRFFRRYDWRVQWLYSQWGEGIRPDTWDVENTPEEVLPATKMLRDGQVLIRRGGKTYDVQGKQIQQ